MASTSTVRRARKTHYCGSCNRFGAIKPGDQYILGTIFPGDDCGQPRRGGHPVRIRECRDCAQRYGRSDRFTPTEATDKPVVLPDGRSIRTVHLPEMETEHV